MNRIERRLLAIVDELADLAREEELVEAELSYHRLIDDDAQRDAVVTGIESDRLEAGLTQADVARFERRQVQIGRRRAKLEARRLSLLAKIR